MLVCRSTPARRDVSARPKRYALRPRLDSSVAMRGPARSSASMRSSGASAARTLHARRASPWRQSQLEGVEVDGEPLEARGEARAAHRDGPAPAAARPDVHGGAASAPDAPRERLSASASSAAP